MPDSPTTIAALSSALDQGYRILTPNHRTAVQVHESLREWRKKHSGVLAGRSPAISAIDIWLRELFEECFHHSDRLPALTLLEGYQELALWQRLIRDSELSGSLVNLENAAVMVLEAHRLMAQWQISVARLRQFQQPDSGTAYLDDCSAFIRWSDAYKRYCRDKGLISFAGRLQQVLPLLQDISDRLPEKIILLGFTDPPPLYQDLFAVLEQHCKLQKLQWQTQQPEKKLHGFADSNAEISACIAWSKTLLEQNSDVKIGIISAELNEQLPFLKRLLRAGFDEHAQATPPYFIASDPGLAGDLPLLLEIPALLRFNFDTLPALEVCRLLRSPLLIAHESENRERAAMEYRLRRNGSYMIGSAHLRSQLGQDREEWHCPVLQQALLACETLRRQQKNRQALSRWADCFASQLGILIWPDPRDELPHLSLLQSCTLEALHKMKKLDFIDHQVSLAEALGQFTQLLGSIPAPNNRQEAPIQILNPGDAQGMRFTHLWFLGLSDLQWPESRHANPFIPLALQRSAGLPDCSAEQVYTQARDALLDLAANTATQINFSYPRNHENGHLQMSPLVLELIPEMVEEHNDDALLSTRLQPDTLACYQRGLQEDLLEIAEENVLLAFADEQPAQGGVSLIANQALCPFKAFAVHRLQAHELPPLNYGIPAFDIGNMLHRILEYFWRELKSSHALQQSSDAEIDALLQQACAAGLDGLQKKHPLLLQSRYRNLEQKRLSDLLWRWLEFEKKRDTFTVARNEYSVDWRHAELSLQFRIDRIDQTRDGFVLIDYKSGRQDSIRWDDERPDSPQLMLYAAALQQEMKFQPVSALLYASVNIDKPGYSGISETPDTYPGIALQQDRHLSASFSWGELVQHWTYALENLAQEFLSGYLAVRPKNRKACDRCHLDAFCRIAEKESGKESGKESAADE